MRSASVRTNPHEYAGTGANRQEKTPTETGWGFIIGGLAGIEPASADYQYAVIDGVGHFFLQREAPALVTAEIESWPMK